MSASSKRWLKIGAVVAIVASVAGAGTTYRTWWPRVAAGLDAIVRGQKDTGDQAIEPESHDHADTTIVRWTAMHMDNANRYR